MAKLVFLFIALFCILQIAQAARIVRDTEDQANDVGKRLEEVFQQTLKQLEENFEKMGDSAKELGEKFANAGKQILAKIEEKSQSS